jgi:hypothetical protein
MTAAAEVAMDELLEVLERRRDVAMLGREWLTSLESLTGEIGGAMPSRPRTRPVTECPRLLPAFRERRISPQCVAERHLAGVVGELSPRLAAVLFSERLRPAGLVEWWPGQREGQEVLGSGWLIDPDAMRLLSTAASGPAELWIVQDAWDFLAAGAEWSEVREGHRGVVGIVDGRWSWVLANRVPDGTEVLVCAGPTAREVFSTFQGRHRVSVRGWRPADGPRRCA